MSDFPVCTPTGELTAMTPINKTSPSNSLPPKKSTISPKKEREKRTPPHAPLTAGGKKWNKAVVSTTKHNNFKNLFDFSESKYKDRALNWISAKKYGPWCEENPDVIAIDCEMVECTDPVTGEIDGKALARLSIVSGTDASLKIFDSLVKPYLPITNYRTRINGIKEEDLKDCTFTLRHAQHMMLKLCSEETVIIGHALHNDLISLKMDHNRVVDTALLYQSEDDSSKTCSLRDLTTSVLKEDMPNVHNSVLDAKNSLLCAEHYLNNDGNVDLVTRTPKAGIGGGGGNNDDNTTNGGDTLFAHRVPQICDADHISKMILKHTKIAPNAIEGFEKPMNQGFCKCIIRFSSEVHCNLAFEALDGQVVIDKSERLQKRVFMKTGEYIFIRKNVRNVVVVGGEKKK